MSAGTDAPPRRRSVVLAVLAVAATAAALITLSGDHHGYDLLVYRGAVRTWLHGGDLYGYVHPGVLHQGFTYPPFAAICLIPLALLPLGLAALFNQVATALAITWTTWVVVRPLARRYGQPVWLATTIATCVASLLEPVRDTIGFGQVNLYLVALVLADCLVLRRDSRWAGVGIGLATAIKLTPGLFVVFLWLSGRRRAAWTAAAVGAGATLLAAAAAPSTSTQFWLHSLRDTSRVGAVDSVSNQALSGLLSRSWDVPAPPPWLWLPLVLIVALIGLRRAVLAANAGNDVAAIALVGLTATLVSPISWVHHLWWVVPAAVGLLADGLHRRRWGPLTAAVGVLAVFASSIPEQVRLGPTGHATVGSVDWFGQNAYVLVMLVLLATLPVRAVGLRTMNRSGDPASTHVRPAEGLPRATPD